VRKTVLDTGEGSLLALNNETRVLGIQEGIEYGKARTQADSIKTQEWRLSLVFWRI
jgi:hypothetical protein